MTKSEFENKAFALLKQCGEGALTSVSENGYPRSCIIGIIGSNSYCEMYFSTGADGTKVRHFKSNPKASVCYYKGPDSVTLSGEVKIVTVLAEKKRVWHDWMFEFFPGGPADENYALLKFTGKEATFLIEGDFLRDEPIGG